MGRGSRRLKVKEKKGGGVEGGQRGAGGHGSGEEGESGSWEGGREPGESGKWKTELGREKVVGCGRREGKVVGVEKEGDGERKGGNI